MEKHTIEYRVIEPKMNWPTAITTWLIIGGWVHGVVVASGFWATLASVLLPPFAWVLSMQWFISLAG